MKILVLVISVFMVCPLLAQTHEKSNTGNNKSQTKPADKTASQNANREPAVLPTEQKLSTSSAQDGTQRKENQSQTQTPFLTHGEWVISILTFVYVVLTGIYVYISSKTLADIKRQADLMEAQAQSSTDQFNKHFGEIQTAGVKTNSLIEQATAQANALRDVAQASKASSDALRISERPWIMVRLKKGPLREGFQTRKDGTNENIICFDWSLSNYGKTPAIVYEMCAHFEVKTWDELEKLSKNGLSPNTKPLRPDTFIVPPDEIHICPSIAMVHYWTDEQRAAVFKNDACLVAYGVVRYRDAITNDPHETPFLGWYVFIDFKEGEFRWLYDPGYNKYT